MSRVQDLARAYGEGNATAADVVAAAKKAEAAADYSDYQAPDREEALSGVTDDAAPYNPDGWDGVTGVYIADGLTDQQYAELHALYVAR